MTPTSPRTSPPLCRIACKYATASADTCSPGHNTGMPGGYGQTTSAAMRPAASTEARRRRRQRRLPRAHDRFGRPRKDAPMITAAVVPRGVGVPGGGCLRPVFPAPRSKPPSFRRRRRRWPGPARDGRSPSPLGRRSRRKPPRRQTRSIRCRPLGSSSFVGSAPGRGDVLDIIP